MYNLIHHLNIMIVIINILCNLCMRKKTRATCLRLRSIQYMLPETTATPKGDGRLLRMYTRLPPLYDTLWNTTRNKSTHDILEAVCVQMNGLFVYTLNSSSAIHNIYHSRVMKHKWSGYQGSITYWADRVRVRVRAVGSVDIWPYLNGVNYGVCPVDMWPYLDGVNYGVCPVDMWPYLDGVNYGVCPVDMWPYLDGVNYGV